MYLLDTSAWIEMIVGTDSGKKIKETIRGIQIFTPSVTIAEVSKWCYKQGSNSKKTIEDIEKSSIQILYTTRSSEQRAGQLCVEVNKKNLKEKQVGLIDCIIAAIAEENDLTVLTKDKHFLLFEKTKKEII